MSLTTAIYLLAATVVVGGGIGLMAEMSPKEIAAQIGLMAAFGFSMFGLVALLI